MQVRGLGASVGGHSYRHDPRDSEGLDFQASPPLRKLGVSLRDSQLTIA